MLHVFKEVYSIKYVLWLNLHSLIFQPIVAYEHRNHFLWELYAMVALLGNDGSFRIGMHGGVAPCSKPRSVPSTY